MSATDARAEARRIAHRTPKNAANFLPKQEGEVAGLREAQRATGGRASPPYTAEGAGRADITLMLQQKAGSLGIGIRACAADAGRHGGLGRRRRRVGARRSERRRQRLRGGGQGRGERRRRGEGGGRHRGEARGTTACAVRMAVRMAVRVSVRVRARDVRVRRGRGGAAGGGRRWGARQADELVGWPVRALTLGRAVGGGLARAAHLERRARRLRGAALVAMDDLNRRSAEAISGCMCRVRVSCRVVPCAWRVPCACCATHGRTFLLKNGRRTIRGVTSSRQAAVKWPTSRSSSHKDRSVTNEGSGTVASCSPSRSNSSTAVSERRAMSEGDTAHRPS